MKCPYCGAEVKEDDIFCGECGKPLRRRKIEIALPLPRKIEISSIWKWGSMIASLVLIFSIWAICIEETYYGEELLIILLIFGFPATIYLMYKERAKKIKYGLAWILFPILTWFSGIPYGWYYYRFYDRTPETFAIFIILLILAIVIDVIYAYYVYKQDKRK